MFFLHSNAGVNNMLVSCPHSNVGVDNMLMCCPHSNVGVDDKRVFCPRVTTDQYNCHLNRGLMLFTTTGVPHSLMLNQRSKARQWVWRCKATEM